MEQIIQYVVPTMSIAWQPLVMLGVLVVIDYLTGIVKGAMAGNLSSSKMREGLWHKATYVVVIILAIMVEYGAHYIDWGIDIATGVYDIAVAWIAITEMLSIIENLCDINPKLKDLPFFQMFGQQSSVDDDLQQDLDLDALMEEELDDIKEELLSIANEGRG